MIGVVGRDSAHADHLAIPLMDADHQVQLTDLSALDPESMEYVVVGGDRALIDLVQAECTIPAIPVETGPGVPAFNPSALPAVISRLTDTVDPVRHYPLLSVTRAGNKIGHALFDVTVITTEPTTISEYEITTDQTTVRFRADGVLVATPIGSHGYARAAGGPRLTTDTPAISVVPIAEFSLSTDEWVVPIESQITVQCVRDEASVGLHLDGRRTRPVVTTDRLTITQNGSFPLVTPAILE